MPTEVVIIAAMAKNRVIGRGLIIPWYVPGEQSRFKTVTMGHSLIMGRKTFESIGKPLPGRRNIVITRNARLRWEGCEVASSFAEALRLCIGEQKVFVIGGEQIFRKALSVTSTIILTTLLQSVDGDVFFPEFKGFIKVSEEKVDGPIPYIVEVYKRCGKSFV